jgi:antitoxin CcdA
MQFSYDRHAPRRAVNLTANSDLVNRVRAECGNLSQLLEQTMINYLAERELIRWKEQNRAAFDSYNVMIAERGTLSEDIGQLL